MRGKKRKENLTNLTKEIHIHIKRWAYY